MAMPFAETFPQRTVSGSADFSPMNDNSIEGLLSSTAHQPWLWNKTILRVTINDNLFFQRKAILHSMKVWSQLTPYELVLVPPGSPAEIVFADLGEVKRAFPGAVDGREAAVAIVITDSANAPVVAYIGVDSRVLSNLSEYEVAVHELGHLWFADNYGGDSARTVMTLAGGLNPREEEIILLQMKYGPSPHPNLIVLDQPVKRVFGGDGADTISGSSGADGVYGNRHDDLIMANDGEDSLYGGQGNDVVHGDAGDDRVYGNLANDSVYGGQGNDSVYGGQGNDVVHGDAGNDWLVGGRGDDTFVGGDGADTVVPGDGANVITDFRPDDRIHLDEGVRGTSDTPEGIVIQYDGGWVKVLGIHKIDLGWFV